jgi:amino acid adenylation domain-containing protein
MTRPQRLLREGFLQSAARHPEKVALVVEGKQYTYGRLFDMSRRLAWALLDRGMKRGDRVAIYMDNTWPCIVSIYGALLAGGVFLMINPQTKADKLHFILHDSGAAFLLTDGHLAGQFVKAVNGLPALQGIITSGKLPLTDQVAVGLDPFDAVVQESEPLAEPCFIIPNDLAALIYTSGSTGNPKGVMQTHQAMVFAAWSLIEYLRLSEQDRILLVLPLAFDYGLYQLLMAMKLGATLVVERSFTFPGRVYEIMRNEHVTVFPGVPTIFSTMIAGHKRKNLFFPDVTRVTNTAAALSAEFIPWLHEIFPNALLYKMYGLTECKRVSYLEPELVDEKPSSVGRPIPGTEVFLRTPEGEPVTPGNDGILYVRGPHVMAGYWNQPEQTAQMLQPGLVPGERILCTGDWFRMDEDGFLYFSGRSDDIIKTRGEKVSPVEVERVLHAIEGIREAVVAGVDDPHFGQAVCAFVVLQEECDLTDRKIKKICLARLENFMVPRDVFCLDVFPKTANGKVDIKALLAKCYTEDE